MTHFHVGIIQFIIAGTKTDVSRMSNLAVASIFHHSRKLFWVTNNQLRPWPHQQQYFERILTITPFISLSTNSSYDPMQQAIFFTSTLLTTTLSTAFRPASSLTHIGKHRHRNTATASTSTTLNINMAIDKPYGAWESPITSKAITAGSVKLGGVYYSNNNVYWLEGRPQEGGRNVLCKHAPNDTNKNERNGIDISPKESNVRTRVHEYGGGAVVMRGKGIFYSEFTTQKLCKLFEDGSNKTIPALNNDKEEVEGRYRYADGVLSSNGHVMYCIREDHKHPEPKNVVNEIVSIDVRDGYTKVLATGNDFYSSPRVSSNGKKLAYITWYVVHS